MKGIHYIIMIVLVILVTSSAAAQQKVVVIPLLKCADPLTNCTGTCVDTLNNPAYCGGCASSCNSGSFCNQGTCQQIDCSTSADCPQGRCNTTTNKCIAAKLVFLSDDPITYAMGGLAGADAICQQQASAASLPGTYMAWLSDSTASPATRFQKYDMPYMRTDGVRVADNWADLTNGTIQNQINVRADGTRTGVPTIATGVWTATDAAGDTLFGPGPLSGVCNEWDTAGQGVWNFFNGYIGVIAVISPASNLNNAWTQSYTKVCFDDPESSTIKKYIYCIQQ